MNKKFIIEESSIPGRIGMKLAKRLNFFKSKVTDNAEFDIKNDKNSPFHEDKNKDRNYKKTMHFTMVNYFVRMTLVTLIMVLQVKLLVYRGLS